MFETWEELENSVINCKKCKLCTGRTNIVFGTGNKNADVMLIGEGPRSRRGQTRRTICRKSRNTYE